MRKILLVVVALLVFLSSGAALAADVVLTSVGQSPDAMMVRVVLKKMKVESESEPLLKAEELGEQKVLIAVVGGSSKGLGAAGIDKDQEITRVTELFKVSKEKGMKLLVMHVGGEGRRGTLSDAFIESAAPSADQIIVVDGGNDDKIFDRLVEGKNVTIHTAATVNGTSGPLQEILSEWGVSR